MSVVQLIELYKSSIIKTSKYFPIYESMKGNLGSFVVYLVVWEVKLGLVILKHALLILDLVIGSYEV